MASAATPPRWQIAGDYFENCNCDVVCPCLFSGKPPLTAAPTAGACEVPIAFHIEGGSFDGVTLDGLNAVLVIRTPGAMADGNWALALYIDDRADQRQGEAIQAIFTGAAGGPVAGLAPLVTNVLGVKKVPITYRIDGKRRSVEIPGVLQLAVRATPSVVPDAEIVAINAHPFALQGLTMAVGEDGSTWGDYGMQWDNSGKNGHYAPIRWANA